MTSTTRREFLQLTGAAAASLVIPNHFAVSGTLAAIGEPNCVSLTIAGLQEKTSWCVMNATTHEMIFTGTTDESGSETVSVPADLINEPVIVRARKSGVMSLAFETALPDEHDTTLTMLQVEGRAFE